MVAKQKDKFCDSAYLEESYKMHVGFVALKYIFEKKHATE